MWMRSRCVVVAVWVVSVCWSLGEAGAEVRYRLVDLGTLGGSESKAYGVNSRGQVVGESKTSSNHNAGFVWQNGVMTKLSGPLGDYSRALDINDTGTIVGSFITGSIETHAAMWTAPGTYTDLDVLPGHGTSVALAVNNQSVVVGWSGLEGSSGSGRAFRYDGALTDIGIGGMNSSADGINDSGDVAMNFWLGQPHPATGGLPKATMSAIVFGGGGFSMPSAVSGQAVVGTWDVNDSGHMVGRAGGVSIAYAYERRHPSGAQDSGIRQITTADSSAAALNNLDVSVGAFYDGSDYRAWVCGSYANGAAEDLNGLIAPASGWDLQYAEDINDLGQIVGTGLYQGVCRAFLLNPIGGGTGQNNPRLPDTIDGSIKQFVDCISGSWVDPEVAQQYDFATTDGSLFTSILDFPEGFEPLTVEVNGESLPGFGPGDELDFVAMFGGGVTEFSVTGIQALGDEPFALQLAFDSLQADFDMTAVPEPGTLALLAGGFALAAIRRRRR